MQALAQQPTPASPFQIAAKAELEAFRTFLTEDKKNHIYYLKERWIDEKEYEDFAEYKTAAGNCFKDSKYKVCSLTQGFKLTLQNTETKLFIIATFNWNSLKYQIKKIG